MATRIRRFRGEFTVADVGIGRQGVGRGGAAHRGCFPSEMVLYAVWCIYLWCRTTCVQSAVIYAELLVGTRP